MPCHPHPYLPAFWASRDSSVEKTGLGQWGTEDSSDPELSCIPLPGRTPFLKSFSQLLSLTWEGFGARFGRQAPSLHYFHFQLATPVHDGNVHVPCKGEEGQSRQSQTRGRPASLGAARQSAEAAATREGHETKSARVRAALGRPL